MEFNIGLAADHAANIAQLEDKLFGNNLEVIYGIDKELKVIYVNDENKLIAFLTFKREGRNIEVYNLGVDADYRRQKIGSRILSSLTNFNLSLEVRESNLVAISFYESLGFFKSFVRKNYYGNENAIVLERYKTMKENAYAKINLILNVVDRKPNGYHEIEFLMNSVDLHDVVTVTKSEEDQVVVIGSPELSNLDNLGYTALEILRTEFGFKTKYKIEIEKNIPVAAGMAGGSSDAAAVMRIINTLEDLNLTEAELANLGAKVGSDVSYCIYSRLAIARGTGEQIELVENNLPNKYVLVVNPGVGLSTAAVYQNHKLSSDAGDISKLLNATNHQQFETELFNSLAPTAFELCPQMTTLYQELQAATENRILVSGSGPTLLVFDEDKTVIEELYAKFKQKYDNCHIAKMN